MCLDGPTFVATEGWNWIPAIRDRDTGIWQPVTLAASGGVRIGDPQVVTSLLPPDTSHASILITVPLENTTNSPVHGRLRAAFDQIEVTKDITAAPGHSEAKLTPAEFSQLMIEHPRLWWPNGYGKQELYQLRLSFSENGTESHVKQLRFGIREISYELSLLDARGHLRRLEYAPTTRRDANEPVVAESHTAIREIPLLDPLPPNFPQDWKARWKSWVASLAPGAESSPAVHMLDDTRVTPLW